MSEQVGLVTRLLASFCAICPFCICARKWPASRYARAMRRIEAGCPACRAYAILNRKDQ